MAGWTRVLAALPFSFGRMLRRRGYEAAGVDSSAGYTLRAR